MTAGPEIWAVVPAKGFDGAKQRLSGAFPPAFRSRLAAAMLEDVLDVLSHASRLAGILVVTNDPVVEELARRYGAQTLADGSTAGHTRAVIAGAGILLAQGIEGMLTLPGDIPGVTAGEIDELLRQHGAVPAFTIVPAHDNRGSNAIIASPPDLVPFAFGDDSFLPHLDACRRRGVEPKVLRFEGIGLDVDNPGDLFALAGKHWPTRTNRLLEHSTELAALTGGERSSSP